MEQEEEWEREGLLDPAWEKQQRKVRITSSSILRRKNIQAQGTLHLRPTLKLASLLHDEFD